MNTKRLIVIALTMILAFALAACGSNDPAPPPEDTPVVTETPATTETPEDPTPGAPEEPPITPEPTRWGPLAAEFLDLLASRNYYLKYDLLDASISPDGDVTIKPDEPMPFHCARQDDAYASAATDPFGEYSLIMHVVQKDNKDYYINHAKGVVSVSEPEKANSSDDKLDTFPVSYMEFIESGVGSVDGVSLPYEDYSLTGFKYILRIYVDGAKVAYTTGILESEISTIRTNFEISRDIPSYMFEFPPDYPLEDYIPPERVSR